LAEHPVISVVDDDASVRIATSNLVRSLGYIVHAFASADDFLRSAELNDTSCVIADVQMPAMSGVELQARLLAQGYRVPFIFITAFPIENIRAPGLGGRIGSHVAANATAPFLGASTNGSFEAESIWFASFRADDKRRDGTFVLSWNRNGTIVNYVQNNAATSPYASETPFPRKFLDPLMTGTGAEEPNYIVLRYAEVLLMIAEAANEVSNGPTAEAYTAVNAVRARAGIPAMTPGLNHDLFRDSVFNERRWELSLEGPNGYFDSQRNWTWAKGRIEQSMKFARSNSSKFPKANNTPINDKYKLMPIPQRALDLNPALRGHQNPGW